MGPDTEYALIPLTRGQVATVDLVDCGRVSKHKWQSDWDKCTRKYYARTSLPTVKGKQTHTSMHRFLLGLQPGEKGKGDHRNLNPLDCRSRNLRIATDAQNARNCRLPAHNTSGFKGVSRYKGKFMARIRVNDKLIHLGTYLTAESAHEAYCHAAKLHHGEFARFE